MEFLKYQHIEKFGTSEVQNIELGECYVFPKIDGTNASVWRVGDKIKAGSRTRELTLDSDNAGFYNWVCDSTELNNYLEENPTHRLYGEWLVPHSLKTYKQSAWRNFYVFDVMVGENYLTYEEYKPLLEKHSINYCPPICKINNGSYDHFIKQLNNNVFLIEDGKGVGEGVVIKNYAFKNKHGRQTWAKIVTSEFKEVHSKVMGAPEMDGKKLIEEDIANKYVTLALIEKEHAKISVEQDGWNSKLIPRLLNTVYYSLVKEESWEFIKEFKNPTINYKTLQHFVVNTIKSKKPELF